MERPEVRRCRPARSIRAPARAPGSGRESIAPLRYSTPRLTLTVKDGARASRLAREVGVLQRLFGQSVSQAVSRRVRCDALIVNPGETVTSSDQLAAMPSSPVAPRFSLRSVPLVFVAKGDHHRDGRRCTWLLRRHPIRGWSNG
jgi:hypothetical protein